VVTIYPTIFCHACNCHIHRFFAEGIGRRVLDRVINVTTVALDRGESCSTYCNMRDWASSEVNDTL